MHQKKAKKSVLRQTLKIYWSEAKKHKALLIISLVSVPSVYILANIEQIWIADIINKLTTQNIQKSNLLAEFAPLIALFVGTQVFRTLVAWQIVNWSVWSLENHILRSLRAKVFDKLSEESMTFHANRFSGSLTSQSNKFVNAYYNYADTTFFLVTPLVISIIMILVILTPQMPLFTFILFCLGIVYAFLVVRNAKRAKILYTKAAKTTSKQTGFLSDVISNILTVKSNAREKYEKDRYERINTKIYETETATRKFVSSRGAQLGALRIIMQAGVIITLVFGQEWFGVSIGTLVLAMTYSRQLFNDLKNIDTISKNYTRASADSLEMTEIMSEKSKIIDNKRAKKLVLANPEIKLDNITFTHEDKKKPLFNNFNLTIKPGERVGLVGHSGSGKTTLTKLLLRFDDVDSGEILLDNQNIAKVSQKSLRDNIAYVPQESILFHRSVAENIAYGKPGATEEEIIEAAKLANAWEFIKDMPNGLKTKTGERGSKLSGGQRQRIAIARALLKNSPILILDEATSALDTESEKLIQEALDNLMKNRTSVVIAHRLSTVKNLDRIIVMEDGEIVEDGSHNELLKLDKVYANLWNIQAGE